MLKDADVFLTNIRGFQLEKYGNFGIGSDPL